MHGQGEHLLVSRKDARCAVALVHIQINDGHLQGLLVHTTPLGLHQARGHGRIVEHTKTAALVRIRVVRAACQVGRHALSAKQG